MIKTKQIQLFIALVILVVNSDAGMSQNSQSQEFDASGVLDVIVDANQIFNIDIITHKLDKIIITSSLEGEYKSSYQVSSKIQDNKLEIALLKQPFTTIEDNKLSAHKVISAALRIEIPQHLNLAVTSDIGFVNLKGQFNDVYIKLVHGQCTVNGQVKNAVITTDNGNINIETASAKIEAISNHGNVLLDDFSSELSNWKLHSINGNIKVLQQ